MKKILLITRHAVPNYGSLLQTIATVQIFKSKGFDIKVLDYVPEEEKPENLYIPMLLQSRFSQQKILSKIYSLLRKPDFKHMGVKFRNFQKQHLPLTKEYNSLSYCSELKYDAYITGSDQVWGKIGLKPYDLNYFLAFTESNNKFSFCSSFGRLNFTKEELRTYKVLLQKYQSLTVRENTAVNILHQLGFDDAKQILDPTLMIDDSFWQQFATSINIKHKYILIYQLHDNKKMNNYAIELKKKLGYSLIRISPSIAHIIRCGKLIYLPSPDKFLGLIKNASYILTDSFHATAFSLVFKKNFTIINAGKTNTRIESLLELFGLENRMINSYSDFSQIHDYIDYEHVKSILKNEREASYNIITDYIFKYII